MSGFIGTKLTMNLGERSYDIILKNGALENLYQSIKSRPLPHVPFDYYFYVELVGDPSADKTAALLRELDHTCRTVRLLGVYTK